MRINFLIVNIYGLGGTIRTVINTANHLAEKGYKVRIVTLFKSAEKPLFDIHPNVKIKVLNNLSKNKLGFKHTLKRVLRTQKSVLTNKHDVAYGLFNLHTDIILRRFLKSLNNEVLVTTRPALNLLAAKYTNDSVVTIGQEHMNINAYKEELKRDIKKNYKKLNYLATLTDEDNKDYSELFKNCDLKVVKITNGIPELDGEVSKLKNKTIVAAGRLTRQKGFDFLIDAFDLIKDKYPDWKIQIYGKGALKSKLQQQINEKHLYNNILLMGPTDNITEKFLESSIFVLSSRYEGFGMVIVEAMQCGVPVVSFDCPRGPGEILTHNHDGLLVEKENPEELAKALSILMDSYEERVRMGSNALERVKDFSIDVIGQEWIKLLDEINSNK